MRNAESVEPTLPTPREVGTIPPGIKQMDFRLPFGYYQIDIRSRYNNKKYIEMLKVMPFRGQVGQSYSVSEVGKPIIQKYTSPDDFPGTYPTEGAGAPLPDGASYDLIVEAAQNCPVDAITLTGPDGERLYP